ncbi:BF3164 family lipoprotein [Belliella pelovolcani]|uniref:BF3164 family lipoprotein n=1 Tax=Belliella pelovolcani TaxID=529505 RepID=UPI003919776C
MKRLIIIYIIVAIFLSCSKKEKEGKIIIETKIELKRYEFSEKLIFKSGDFDVFNGKLLIRNHLSQKLLTLYDLINNVEIQSILEIGDGPDEFSKIISFKHISNEKITIYEKDIFRYNIIELSKDSIKKIYRYPKLDSDNSNLVGNDQYFIANGYFQKRFNLYNLKDKSEIQFGEYPEIGKPINENSKGMFFQGYGVLNSQSSIYAFATNSIPTVDFYKLGGSEPKLIKRVEYPYEMDFADHSNDRLISIRYNDNHKFGFRSITSSKEYIFILYSGKSKFTDGNLYSSGNEIHVFNFEGELLTKLNFDLPLNVIRVDAEMNVLYGISPTSDDAIYYFSLVDYGL